MIEKDFIIDISTDKTVYVTGEEVKLTAVFKNLSNNKYDVTHSGRLVYFDIYKINEKPPSLCSSIAIFETIEKGAIVTKKLTHQFLEEGDYTVCARTDFRISKINNSDDINRILNITVPFISGRVISLKSEILTIKVTGEQIEDKSNHIEGYIREFNSMDKRTK